jgi:proline iminopeptidase
VDQRYHVAGAGPVCLVHPGGPGIGWEYLRMPELERSMTMVYLESVGTGVSGRLSDPRDYNPSTYTHFLHAVIEHLALPQIMVLGHSHGGFVAQRYALDHPDRVASLILYDTSPVIVTTSGGPRLPTWSTSPVTTSPSTPRWPATSPG